MVLISKGDFIWIKATASPATPIGVYAAPIGARVVNAAGDKILVIDDNGIERKLSTDKRIRVMHPTSIQGVEDLIQLGDLHEAAVIRNLHIRFCEKLIYTYCGSMLIALNPNKVLPIYSIDQMSQYEDQRIGALPPHIFAIAANAYSNILQQGLTVQDQCIIVSGESGAGKTENTKFIVQYLANVSAKSDSTKTHLSCIEQQIVDANPILEAFGNAKSIRNHNSSRFGKFIDLQFNSKTGAIEAVRIEHFLLEKSRIVLQLPEERNFHIFYSLLKGLNPTEKFELELGNAGDYHMLIQNRNQCLDDMYRSVPELCEIRSAMKVLMFKDAEIVSIFKVLAALLHTGNLKYQVQTDENGEKADICDLLNVGRICKLLQIDAENLTKTFCKRSIVMRGEHIVTNLNTVQALDLRDAFIKGVYNKIFDYVVRRINDAIYRPCSATSNNLNDDEASQKVTTEKRRSIGVLDIFGFEDVGSSRNSFEQLCINYASEHLQQYYIRQVFKLEQAEYEAQHITWNRIEFEAFDNLPTLEMLAVQPLSIFSLLNDESIFPQATNQTFLEKLHSNHGHNESCYIKPKSDLSKVFGVNHYAGPVFYQINGFIEKNRDQFSADLLSLIESSRFRFLHRLFESESRSHDGTNPLSNEDNGYGAISSIRQTVSLRFRRSLESLMNRLEIRQPFFVRCIKSNDTKKPMYFDRNLVTKQLQCSGVLEATFICKAGFPVRIDYANFVNRYRVFLPGFAPAQKVDYVQAARHICAIVLGPEANYQFGKTKVFLKKEHELILQNELEKILMHYAVILQKSIRGWIQCRNFKCLRTAAIVLQKHWRAYIQKIKYKRILLGISRLQASFRSYQLVLHYDRLKSVVTQFQACCRGSILRSILRRACSRNDCRAAMLSRIQNGDMNSSLIKEEDCFGDDVNNNYYCQQKMKANECGEEDYSIYRFDKFAATHFQNQTNEMFIRKPIYHSLLQHDSISEQMASISIWICLLKFMNDLQEPTKNFEEGLQTDEQEKENEPFMTRVLAALAKNYTQANYEKLLEVVAQFNPNTQNSVFNPHYATTKINRNDSNKSETNSDYNNQRNNAFNFYVYFLSNLKAKSNFELIHFIIAHGIVKPSLRDEIYCQICKQLNGNISRTSLERGWILLALCAGCFAPTPKFFKYLKCYLQENCPRNAKDYNAFVNTRLDRTIENGTRRHPPSRIELEACKSKKPIELTIAFMNKSVCTVIADSASNSLEICSQLSQKIGLVTVNSKTNNSNLSRSEDSTFGFSLYIALFEKVSSLGAGSDHVLDAISQSEQLVHTSTDKVHWQLFFRKEIFAPWHNSSLNSVSTNLIYEQIVRGVRFGEYPCDKEEDLALLCAQRYFIDHGAVNVIDVDILSKALCNYLPETELSKGDAHLNTEKWLQVVLNTFRKINSDSVKEEIVSFAMHRWPLFFSRFCDAFKFMGPPLRTNEVIIAVNWTGLSILDNEDQKLVEFSFPEIARVSCTISKIIGADTVTFQFVNGDDYIFQSPNAQDICNLVEYFLKGLQKRSKYLLAMRPINPVLQENGQTNEKPILICDKGDLLILTNDQTGETVAKESFVSVENTRNGLHGLVPTNSVYIFPILTKPSVDLIEMFNHQNPEPIYNLSAEQQLLNGHNALLPYPHYIHSSSLIYRPHTLERFSVDNFYASTQSQSTTSLAPQIEGSNIENDFNENSILSQKELALTQNRSISLLPPNPVNIMPFVPQPPPHIYSHNDLWRWSPHPIKRPLLKRIGGMMEAPSVEAVFGYEYILKYMGDFPTQRPKYFLEFTDIIFRAPLKYQILHDEVYCQLMKQLTDNPNPLSEERGWELMWLCLGLFPPSVGLEKELSHFLRSRFLPIAADCVIRLQKIVKIGGLRKFPPHQVEVEAIQHKTTQIFHKVFLPDGSEEVIEVDSLTNARDFAARIVARLHLKSGVGFNIFVKVGEKVISMPENEYLFDFIHQLADWMLQNRAHLKQTNHPQIFAYQIFFMRKLWINVTPGDDLNADSIFHYHQELPKYLRGYHNVTKQQAVQIAAIILRAQTRDDKSPPFQQFQHIVQDIIPRDLRKAYSTSEWKKLIVAEFEALKIRSSTAGKLEFLKYMSQFPTFGSAFFEVKPSDPTLAPRVVVAINRNGINLFNQDNKEHIVSYPFTAINNWMSGNTYFHLTLGSLIKGNRLLFETTLGYKMDDLLTSYIQILLSAIDNNQKSNMSHKEIYEMEIV